MQTTAKMRVVLTGVEVKPDESDPEKNHVEVEMFSIGGVSRDLADFLKDAIYNNDESGSPKVLEVTMTYRDHSGSIAGPAKKISVSVRTSGGDDGSEG